MGMELVAALARPAHQQLGSRSALRQAVARQCDSERAALRQAVAAARQSLRNEAEAAAAVGMELVAALARPARSASAARQSLRAQTGTCSAMHQQLGSRSQRSGGSRRSGSGAGCCPRSTCASAARQSLRAQTGSRSAMRLVVSLSDLTGTNFGGVDANIKQDCRGQGRKIVSLHYRNR